ncbi:unnamed protein product [Pedinophyceae sp. YPF-701]|nr:unnamed protein product [Pedinophyceae sp. YPF-701]
MLVTEQRTPQALSGDFTATSAVPALCAARRGIIDKVKQKLQDAQDTAKKATESLADKDGAMKDSADALKSFAGAFTEGLREEFGAKGAGGGKGGKRGGVEDKAGGSEEAAGAAAEEAGQRESRGAAEGEQAAGAGAGRAASGGGVGRVFALLKAALGPEDAGRSKSIRSHGLAKPEQPDASTATDIVTSQARKSEWEKRFDGLRDWAGRAGVTKGYDAVASSATLQRLREAADDARERWETWDHPLAHRIQDAVDRVATQPEAAQALEEARRRDPSFFLPGFVLSIAGDVRDIVVAELRGDEDVLKEFCSEELVERLTAQSRAVKEQLGEPDTRILHAREPQLVSVKLIEGDPIVVVQVEVQRVHCIRDKFGNVVEGGPDEIRAVFYHWALQMDKAGFFDEDGEWQPPRWQIADFAVLGAHALL